MNFWFFYNASPKLSLKNTQELYQTLNFEENLLNIFQKVNKAIEPLHKLFNLLPRTTFIVIYTAFVRPHLADGNISYNQTFRNFFNDRLELVQHKACLAIMAAIRDISRENFYQELGFFIKFSKMSMLNNFSIYVLIDARYLLQELYTPFLSSE